MRAFIFEKGIDKAPTEVTQYMVFPYGAEYSHDDSLGSACITLRNMDRADIFAAGTIVFVGNGNYTDNVHDQWVVVNSTCTENNATGKYNHTLYLCDITKLLERETIGNKTFTRSIALAELGDAKTFTATISDTSEKYLDSNATSSQFYVVSPVVQSPVLTNYVVATTFASVFPQYGVANVGDELVRRIIFNGQILRSWKYTIGYDDKGTSQITDSSGTVTTETLSLADWISAESSISSVTISGSGTIEFEWSMKTTAYTDSSNENNTRTVYAAVYKTDLTQPTPSNPTLLEACGILEKSNRHQRKHQITVRTIGTSAQREMEQEICDIDISNGTLREGIDTIAGIGGCFSRYKLEYNSDDAQFDHYIDLYPISSLNKADLSLLGQPITRKMQGSIEGACSVLDSTVNNLIDSAEGGSLAEPTDKAWITLRSEDVRITEKTAEIPTTYPIYRIEKLEVKYDTGTSYGSYTADITKYVVEETAYSLLSSYAPAYPRSKAYALYYKRGEKNIKGLSFEQENAISQLLVRPSIVNICNTEFGTNYSDLGLKSGTIKYPDLSFRITYIPIVNATVRQAKPDVQDVRVPNALYYNQSATHVDSVRYGRNLAGAVERSGQPGGTIIYKVKNDVALPSPGDLYDDEYTISKLSVQYGKDYKTVQMDLARYYNRLNPFVGIDSALRLFEISENGYIPRTIVYEDYCIISDSILAGDSSLITSYGLMGFQDALVGSVSNGLFTPQVAYVQGTSETEGELTKCVLPVMSYGLGRSLAFTFGYLDNYSAGDKAVAAETYTNLYRVKEAVPYADSFGEVKSVSIQLADQSYTAGLVSDDLPEAPTSIDSRNIFAIDSLDIYKDSREQILFTYQLHFVTSKGWIVSPAFAEDFKMITRKSSARKRRVKLYRLSYELGRTDTVIDLSKAAEEYWTSGSSQVSFPLTSDSTNRVVSLSTAQRDQYFHGSGVAWAVAYDDGKLLFGANESISTSAPIPNFCFSFRHNIA